MPQEVRFRIEFQTASLGNIRGKDGESDSMEKDANGRVIFMPAWWRAAVIQAARHAGLSQKIVQKIEWDPIVDGTIGFFHRTWKDRRGPQKSGTTIHEAFLKNSEVACHCLVPDDLTEDDFRSVLVKMGEFVGISPYGHKFGFGRFKLVEVIYGSSQKLRGGRTRDSDSNRPVGESDIRGDHIFWPEDGS